MTRPPPHPLDDAPGIAAILGGMLFALLAALLGGARARRRALAVTGVMAAVPLEPVELDYEPWVEWVAVPAPWRACQGIGRSCPRLHGPTGPCGAMQTAVRGPPCPVFGHFYVLPGMA
ncbi:MAG: hypothetical protein NT133_22010 [Alphaproteobacteria bacterium]|nr:hypothetical protein [Alphaproteobacteria bacterium]